MKRLLVKDVLLDMDELRAAVEYDEDIMGNAPMFVGELAKKPKSLLTTIDSGSYELG